MYVCVCVSCDSQMNMQRQKRQQMRHDENALKPQKHHSMAIKYASSFPFYGLHSFISRKICVMRRLHHSKALTVSRHFYHSICLQREWAKMANEMNALLSTWIWRREPCSRVLFWRQPLAASIQRFAWIRGSCSSGHSMGADLRIHFTLSGCVRNRLPSTRFDRLRGIIAPLDYCFHIENRHGKHC